MDPITIAQIEIQFAKAFRLSDQEAEIATPFRLDSQLAWYLASSTLTLIGMVPVQAFLFYGMRGCACARITFHSVDELLGLISIRRARLKSG